MATVSPVVSVVAGVPHVTWTGVVTGDTLVSQTVVTRKLPYASVQISGTFGGATITLQSSNDNTTFFAIKDISGTTVSAVAASIFEILSSAAYLKPTIAGGGANAVDITLILRG